MEKLLKRAQLGDTQAALELLRDAGRRGDAQSAFEAVPWSEPTREAFWHVLSACAGGELPDIGVWPAAVWFNENWPAFERVPHPTMFDESCYPIPDPRWPLIGRFCLADRKRLDVQDCLDETYTEDTMRQHTPFLSHIQCKLLRDRAPYLQEWSWPVDGEALDVLVALGLPDLQVLNLYGSDFSEHSAGVVELLRGFKGHGLGLGECTLLPGALVALRTTRLRSLDLSNNYGLGARLETWLLENTQALANLESVDLSDTGLTSRGLTYLSEASRRVDNGAKLTRVVVRNNNRLGVRCIEDVLRSRPGLELDIRGCSAIKRTIASPVHTILQA